MLGQFDIFSGTFGSQPLWLEAAGDLTTAISRMEQRARLNPGRYFVFSTYCYTVVASIDTQDSGNQGGEQGLQ